MRRLIVSCVLGISAWSFAEGIIDSASFRSLPSDPNSPRRLQLRAIIDNEEMRLFGQRRPAGTQRMTLTANGDHILVTFVAADGSITGQRRINRGGQMAATFVAPAGHSVGGSAFTDDLAGADPSNGASISNGPSVQVGTQRVQFPAGAIGPDFALRLNSGSRIVVPTVKQDRIEAVTSQMGPGATFGVVRERDVVFYRMNEQRSLVQFFPSDVQQL